MNIEDGCVFLNNSKRCFSAVKMTETNQTASCDSNTQTVTKERTSRSKNFSIDSLLSSEDRSTGCNRNGFTCFSNNLYNCGNLASDGLFESVDCFGKNTDSTSSDEVQLVVERGEFAKEEQEELSASEENCSRNFSEGKTTN